MRLGIDFGTTHTSVAAVDRGNYPVVSFQTESGDTQEWYPSLIAVRDEQFLFGLAATACANEPGWLFMRSFKRLLATAAPESTIMLGEHEVSLLDLVTNFLRQLRQDLSTRSNLRIKPDTPVSVMVGVPANANSNQRFLTLEAFRRAGFHVLGMINEPSAAGIEYAFRYRKAAGPRKEYIAVYDLGGGTFDASVIRMTDRYHEVMTSSGLSHLGGDDFDEVLVDLVLSRLGHPSGLVEEARYGLREECREKKESLHPNTRKIVIDLSRLTYSVDEVILSTADFYEGCRPLVDQTLTALETALQRASEEGGGSAVRAPSAIYLVGGSSDLPLVARTLRERYGAKVHKSPYPHAAAAIGLAIAADTEAGYVLRERFTRHFGVWREAANGRIVSFDPIFLKDTLLPAQGDPRLIRALQYRPAHNIGHFRYVECSELRSDTEPAGETMPWDEIYFPFDPALSQDTSLEGIAIARAGAPSDQVIEECYSCDGHGIIEVVIANRTSGYQRSYRLRRMMQPSG